MKKKTKSSGTSKKSLSTVTKKTHSGQLHQNEKPQLIPVGELLHKAWNIVTARFGALLGIGIVHVLVQTSIVIVGLTIAVVVGGSTALQAYLEQGTIWAIFNPNVLSIFGASGIGLVTALVIESVLYQMTVLRVLFAPTERVLHAFRRSVSSFFPALVLYVFVFILTIGGFALLILPGLLLSLWFMFSLFELVLYDATISQSLERSAATVRKHFWGIAGRSFLFVLLTTILTSAFDEVTLSLTSELQPIAEFAHMLFQALIGWIGIAYLGELYRSSRITTSTTRSVQLAVVIASVGWLIAAVFMWNILQNLDSTILDQINQLPW